MVSKKVQLKPSSICNLCWELCNSWRKPMKKIVEFYLLKWENYYFFPPLCVCVYTHIHTHLNVNQTLSLAQGCLMPLPAVAVVLLVVSSAQLRSSLSLLCAPSSLHHSDFVLVAVVLLFCPEWRFFSSFFFTWMWTCLTSVFCPLSTFSSLFNCQPTRPIPMQSSFQHLLILMFALDHIGRHYGHFSDPIICDSCLEFSQ